MNKTAIVNRVVGDEIYLIHIKDYGIKEKTERSFWNIKPQDFKCINPKSYRLKPGDAVEYFIPEGKTIFASFLILIVPLLSFLITFYLLSLIGINSEKIKALLSVSVMILTFYLNKLLKRLGFKEPLPTIVKTIERETLIELKKECKNCGSCSSCD